MHRSRLAVMLLFGVILGCGEGERRMLESTRPKEHNFPDRDNYATVQTFFATDRNMTNSTKPARMFGDERGRLTLGTCRVSIPRDHRLGELESPSALKFEFRQDPEKHIVLLSCQIESSQEYFTQLSDRVQLASQRAAFLFVHGFNVTFEDAARRTAQMAYDLGFEGAPVFYSWPSKGKTSGYLQDAETIKWTQANLRPFLEQFLSTPGMEQAYLIAHSMGNRALTRTISDVMRDRPDLAGKLKEVILMAPDIDAGVFQTEIAPALTAPGRPVTLYASKNDKALQFSKKVNGFARAGDAENGLVIVPGVETIDATNVDTSLVGHAYYAEADSVLSDLYYLIQHGQRAEQRFGLRQVQSATGAYWVFAN